MSEIYGIVDFNGGFGGTGSTTIFECCGCKGHFIDTLTDKNHDILDHNETDGGPYFDDYLIQRKPVFQFYAFPRVLLSIESKLETILLICRGGVCVL